MTARQLFDLGFQHHQSGRLAEAERCYRQVLAEQPDHAESLHLLGVVAHQSGRHAAAVDLIERAMHLKADWPQACTHRGESLRAMGQLEAAIAAHRQAIGLDPNFAQAHYNLGVALKEWGDVDAAIAAYRAALAIIPSYARAHNNLGNALREKGELDAAIAALRSAIALSPDYAEAFSNLAAALSDKGLVDEAVDACRQAIALKPDVAAAYINLAGLLSRKGLLDEAIVAQRQAVALRPSDGDLHLKLAGLLTEVGRLDEAIDSHRAAIALKPDSPQAHCSLGMALAEKRLFSEAAAAYRSAIALKPDYAEAYSNLGTALTERMQCDEALAAFQQAVALKPNLAMAHNNLGSLLKNQGRLDEAITAYRQAMTLEPNDPGAHSNLVYTMLFDPGHGPQAIAEELRRWNQQHAAHLCGSIESDRHDRSPGRPPRIGYISPDFMGHVVGRNLLPLFRQHDRRQFHITCYANVRHPDATTAEFQRHADRWRNIVAMNDEQVAEQIRRDEIDILVDLTLHMANNRLLVFARKPAPVQVTFAGYPGSTGLTAIDYRLSDPYLDPPGMDDSIHSEQTVRLPDSFWCYDALASRETPVNALPAATNGVVTFGCLNNLCKINAASLGLWSRVMRQVPGSRLLLLANDIGPSPQTQQQLSQHGIDPERVEFAARRPYQGYLQLYHRIDVMLDSFPYNGHTTSLDSLWMGVPVVTLVGQTAVARAGWSQLSNLGLTELAAHSEEQFVQVAVDLCNDLPRLSLLRSTLRQRMERSPLMDARRFARNIESAYRQMCQRQRA